MKIETMGTESSSVPVNGQATVAFFHPSAFILHPYLNWRRGWDSNPRRPLSLSGFRDRCTNPLCDLSKSKDEG